MTEKVTPWLRAYLSAALVKGFVGMKELGYTLRTVEGRPATAQEVEDWNEYIPLGQAERDIIRKGLYDDTIDIGRLAGFD